jgi:hypothetical protein
MIVHLGLGLIPVEMLRLVLLFGALPAHQVLTQHDRVTLYVNNLYAVQGAMSRSISLPSDQLASMKSTSPYYPSFGKQTPVDSGLCSCWYTRVNV